MISIPKPCHEDWDRMTPKEQGRHCDKCCKVVVDFSSKTTEQIADFFQANAGKKVCGNFRREQVQPATRTLQPMRKSEVRNPKFEVEIGKTSDFKLRTLDSRAPRYRLFMAALYFVFGGLLFSSCNNAAAKEPEPSALDTPQHCDYIKGKTMYRPPVKDTTTKAVVTPEPKAPLAPVKNNPALPICPIPVSDTVKTVPQPPVLDPEPEDRIYMRGEVAFVPDDTTHTE